MVERKYITGKVALPEDRPDDSYIKKGVSALTDASIEESTCAGSWRKGCSKCECYTVCEYGKEAVRRGIRK